MPASIIVAIKGGCHHRSPSSAAQSGERGQADGCAAVDYCNDGSIEVDLRAVVALVRSQRCLSRSRSKSMGLNKLERYSHAGYLIKVDVMALAGEVARELSPIRSLYDYNYEI